MKNLYDKIKHYFRLILVCVFFILEYVLFFLNGEYSPSKINLSVIGVIFSALSLVIFCLMVHYSSDYKISFTIFTTYLGVATINVIVGLLIGGFYSAHTAPIKIIVIGGAMLLVLIEPFMQISMLINEIMFSANPIGHLIIGVILVIAAFYIVHFISRYLKNRNRKDDENEKVEDS